MGERKERMEERGREGGRVGGWVQGRKELKGREGGKKETRMEKMEVGKKDRTKEMKG